MCSVGPVLGHKKSGVGGGGGGWGVLLYISSMGMCRTLGYGFLAVLVRNRVWFLPF